MNACRPLTRKLRAMQKWRLASSPDLSAQEEIAELVGSDQWSLPERLLCIDVTSKNSNH